jgi:hypothetical protein
VRIVIASPSVEVCEKPAKVLVHGELGSHGADRSRAPLTPGSKPNSLERLRSVAVGLKASNQPVLELSNPSSSGVDPGAAIPPTALNVAESDYPAAEVADLLCGEGRSHDVHVRGHGPDPPR